MARAPAPTTALKVPAKAKADSLQVFAGEALHAGATIPVLGCLARSDKDVALTDALVDAITHAVFTGDLSERRPLTLDGVTWTLEKMRTVYAMAEDEGG